MIVMLREPLNNSDLKKYFEVISKKTHKVFVIF